jgi:hypothetical protein
MGKVVVTAPMDLFQKIAAQERVFMKAQATAMAAHLLEKDWGCEDSAARLELVKVFFAACPPSRSS